MYQRVLINAKTKYKKSALIFWYPAAAEYTMKPTTKTASQCEQVSGSYHNNEIEQKKFTLALILYPILIDCLIKLFILIIQFTRHFSQTL